MSGDSEFFDELETRDPEQREREQGAALAAQVAHARTNTTAYAELLKEVEPEAVTSREALARLPVTRKTELMARQKADPPFGGLTAVAPAEVKRIFQSPGPIYEPEGEEPDYWRLGRALFAAGFRAGDLVHNTFAHHLTPAGRMFETAAHAVGCTVIPGGVGNTELQLEAIAALRPVGYAGTPSFLKILLDKGREVGADTSSLRKASVGGEALPPSLRQELGDMGVRVLQGYGTADLGSIAYESSALEGMIVDEGVIVEIVRPGSGDPVPEGEVGEVVVTTFNKTYPLIRFATGDLSAVLTGQSPCGRTNMRIKGWMGRADQTTKVKGMFVRPEQINQVIDRHPEVLKGRLVVDREGARDVMTLQCETQASGEALATEVAGTIQSVCKVRGEVAFVEPGSLPNDGKIIDDVRTYE
jgi:phenylacetate-CoA ligase